MIVVLLTLDVIPVAVVDCVTDVVGGRTVDGLAILSADDDEFDMSVNLEVEVVE